MKLPTPHSPTARFCRWSRKPYAIFASLRLHVVIGKLRQSAADASLCKIGKTNRLSLLVPVQREDSSPEFEADIGNPPPVPSGQATLFAFSACTLFSPAVTCGEEERMPYTYIYKGTCFNTRSETHKTVRFAPFLYPV